MHKRYTLVTWSLPGFHVNVLLPAQRWLLLTPTCSASPCGCLSATWAHSSWYLVPVVCMKIVLSYWNSSKQGNGTGCLSCSVHSPALTGLSVPVGQHGVVVPINGSCARTASSDGLSWPPPPLEIEILLWFCTEVHVIALVSSKFLLFFSITLDLLITALGFLWQTGSTVSAFLSELFWCWCLCSPSLTWYHAWFFLSPKRWCSKSLLLQCFLKLKLGGVTYSSVTKCMSLANCPEWQCFSMLKAH